jgi:hypothetical protein
MPELVRELFAGPIDVVGDVHGEIDALLELLAALGYSRYGEHPQGRRLVFVGDLCDRGPDSLAVIALVRALVERDLAQCVLGNHELNLLRGARKEGNGWYFSDDHDRRARRFLTSRPMTDEAEREATLQFFATLPVALQRDDLRVAHAAWDSDSLTTLARTAHPTRSVYDTYANELDAAAKRTGLAEQADAEEREHWRAITDPTRNVPLLVNSGRQDELYQMGNPLRVVTSGPERLADQPFFASGKWRMLDRVKWWDDYADPTPVIFGHYWRWPIAGDFGVFGQWKRDLFAGLGARDWCNAQGTAFCVDFSIGARFHERANKVPQFTTRLGAVRWPEQELVLENRERSTLKTP